MFTVDVSEHLTDLLLRQAFRIKSARKTLTFILLVPKNSQYSRMEVSVPVPSEYGRSEYDPFRMSCLDDNRYLWCRADPLLGDIRDVLTP